MSKGKQKTETQSDTLRFLGELFPEVPESSRILVWELRSKKSRWFSDVATAATFAAKQADVYIGCALSPKSFGPNARCPADQTAGIGGLWIDIDYRHTVHRKKKLPSTIEVAVKLGKSTLDPTVILSTGHGIQAWWLFKELWMFDSDEERQSAELLISSWQDVFRRQAASKGWEIDSTHDLARVLRIPGTFNAKGAKHIPVTILECDWTRRFNPDDFEKFFANQMSLGDKEPTEPLPKYTKPSRIIKTDLPQIKVRPDRGANPQKWHALKSVDDRVEATFEHKRRDLNDTSMSGYDMALASFAVQAEWSDQEIADLLVSHRIRHDPRDPKIQRVDYFARTIARARKGGQREFAQQQVEDMADFGVADGIPESMNEEEKKQAMMTALSKTLGITVNRVIRFSSDPPQFRIETDDRHINLGSVENLIEQRRFKNSVAAMTGILMEPIDKKRWPKTAQTLLDCCIDMDAGMEATDKGSLILWLNQYLSERPPLDQEEKDQAAATRFPFFWESQGRIHTALFLSDFINWLRVSLSVKREGRQMGVLFRSFGFKSKQIKIGSRPTWVWVMSNVEIDNRSDEYRIDDADGDSDAV